MNTTTGIDTSENYADYGRQAYAPGFVVENEAGEVIDTDRRHTEQVTTTIPAHALRPGMVASLPHYNHGEPTEIATAEPFGPHLTRITFVDYEHTNTAYTMDRNRGVDVMAYALEMWQGNPDGTPGDTFVMRFPTTTRRHDALRTLATYVLATHDYGTHYTRIPRKHIRVNSVQGIAWDTRNVSNVAYFDNTGK